MKKNKKIEVDANNQYVGSTDNQQYILYSSITSDWTVYPSYKELIIELEQLRKNKVDIEEDFQIYELGRPLKVNLGEISLSPIEEW